MKRAQKDFIDSASSSGSSSNISNSSDISEDSEMVSSSDSAWLGSHREAAAARLCFWRLVRPIQKGVTGYETGYDRLQTGSRCSIVSLKAYLQLCGEGSPRARTLTKGPGSSRAA